MAQGLYAIGQPIDVVYQARDTKSGLTAINMHIYDETFTLITAPVDPTIMTEIGATGRYYANFTPGAEGTWTVLIDDNGSSKGQVVEKFLVAGWNIDSIGDTIATLSAASSDAMLG